jgi:hypothetical protein
LGDFMLHAVVHALEIGIDEFIKGRGRQVQRRSGSLLSCIIDANVEAANSATVASMSLLTSSSFDTSA